MLAPTQLRDRDGIGCIANQMKPAETFYGRDFAALNLSKQLSNFILTGDRRTGFVFQFNMRSAYVTGIRLRVKSAVKRILVLLQTVRAHRKNFHARLRAVIGQLGSDGVAGTAVRAVDKRITVPAIIFVGEFL